MRLNELRDLVLAAEVPHDWHYLPAARSGRAAGLGEPGVGVTPTEHTDVALLADNLDVQVAWGLRAESEPGWAPPYLTVLMHRATFHRVYLELSWRGTPVERFLLDHVDGTFIPSPRVDGRPTWTSDSLGAFDRYQVSALERALAQVVNGRTPHLVTGLDALLAQLAVEVTR